MCNPEEKDGDPSMVMWRGRRVEGSLLLAVAGLAVGAALGTVGVNFEPACSAVRSGVFLCCHECSPCQLSVRRACLTVLQESVSHLRVKVKG